jgi:transglutaminase-like putative cysteine protease
MTTTLSRPAGDRPGAPATAAPVQPRGAGPGRPPGPTPIVAIGTEVSLACVTAAAALGLARLFADGSFVGPVLAAVVGGHAVAWACRRRGLGLLPSALASLAGLVLAVIWLVEPHTTFLLIPRGATWRAIHTDLRTAWRQFGLVKAPTPGLRGFVRASVAAVWTAATVADFFACRVRARFEAMAPAFTLFVFGSILGADHLRLPSTALYLAALLAFVLWSEAARQSSGIAWFAGRGREGDLALLRQGATIALGALLIALVAGPHLPGARSSGYVSFRDTKEGGARSRITVSPLVDIRGRLVDQSNRELFTVQASGPSYWRLTSLDRFDGTIWSSLGTYQPTKGSLPGAGQGHSVAQDYEIGPLGTIWLPAAYRADKVTGVPGARFDRDSGSLLAQSTTSDNLHYSVVSTVADLTAAELEGATGPIPGDVAGHYTELPKDFPGSIIALAHQVTDGSPTPYDKAKALQDFFRTGFTYDLRVPPGHDINAMEHFLFDDRRGYCEQFAGTYAAMARAVGLPARVAVGFVPGTLANDGRYHVDGKDAHAWPEVYLAGYGWVAFEPTPGAGRTAPGTQAYTGVGANSGSDQAADTAPTTTPTTAAGDQSTTTLRAPNELPQPNGTSRSHSGSGTLQRTLWALGLLLAAYVLAVPVGHRVVAGRRRRRARTPSDQVLVAWQEAEEALQLAGHPRRASETADEFARRSAPVVGAAAPQLARLATDSAAAGFAEGGVAADLVAPARQAAGAVTTALRSQAGPVRRLRWELDPRPLVDALPRLPGQRREQRREQRRRRGPGPGGRRGA